MKHINLIASFNNEGTELPSVGMFKLTEDLCKQIQKASDFIATNLDKHPSIDSINLYFKEMDQNYFDSDVALLFNPEPDTDDFLTMVIADEDRDNIKLSYSELGTVHYTNVVVRADGFMFVLSSGNTLAESGMFDIDLVNTWALLEK